MIVRFRFGSVAAGSGLGRKWRSALVGSLAGQCAGESQGGEI